MYEKYIKRFLDIFCSLLAMPIVLLVVIIFAPIIYFSDKGSPFYNSKRIGLGGNTFKMYKLRSMKIDVPDIRNEDGSTYNSEDDPRVTKIGYFMRKKSIDEIPQIINVFFGQMSLIGPRPDPIDDIYIYTDEQKRKLKVRPGITGYNQAYYRNSVLQDEKFAHDVYYADHVSFIFDIKILMKTIKTVFMHKNIYNNASRPSLETKGKYVEKNNDFRCKHSTTPRNSKSKADGI